MTETHGSETPGSQGPDSTLRIDGEDIEDLRPPRRSWRGFLGGGAVAAALLGALLWQSGASPVSVDGPEASEHVTASAGRSAPSLTTVPAPTTCWSTHDITGSLDPPVCSCTSSSSQ